MCGIAGFFNRPENYHDGIMRMIKRIHHRGPDADGIWSNEDHSVVLGHTRLSILDLSDTGSQPMISHDERYVIVLNGEIYNHKEMAEKLLDKGKIAAFRGHSDTEVLLEYIAAYGFEEALAAAAGMFAIGLYDRKERRFYMARDRIGEKPLYYGILDHSFIFCSEIGGIEAVYKEKLNIDPNALSLFFLNGYIPAPYTVYKEVRKLEAGCMLEMGFPFHKPQIRKYWDIMEAAAYGEQHPFKGSFMEAADELERLLKMAVQRQIAADVPVGAFLSGGIDSSAVVAMMQEISPDRVKTFSIGFEDQQYDEAPFAKNTAMYLGTDHTELYVSEDEVMGVIPKLPYIYGEPFADSSQLPTYLVSRLARQKVAVSLSGDAGDELFCGYGSYVSADRIWKKMEHIPKRIRHVFAELLKGFAYGNERAGLIANYMDAGSIEDVYNRSRMYHFYRDGLVPGGNIPDYRYNTYPSGMLKGSPVENVMLMDMLVYHPDDILTKVDRSAMAVSLESRVPLLDRDVIEFVYTLPHRYKYDGKTQKKILKEVLYRYVPKNMMDRPKKGFGIPVADWIRCGKLTEWAQDLLNDNTIRRQGILDADIVHTLWDGFQKTKKDAALIWYILMFQEWMEKRNDSIGK